MLKLAENSKFKQCAQCKFYIEKNHGCNHMTCRCGYEFCYLCGEKYGTCPHSELYDLDEFDDDDRDDILMPRDGRVEREAREGVFLRHILD